MDWGVVYISTSHSQTISITGSTRTKPKPTDWGI
jgi:hypothetical protein